MFAIALAATIEVVAVQAEAVCSVLFGKRVLRSRGLLRDASKANTKLGWVPRITLPGAHQGNCLECDFTEARSDDLVKQSGLRAYDYNQ